jgi:hypothetical protein
MTWKAMMFLFTVLYVGDGRLDQGADRQPAGINPTGDPGAPTLSQIRDHLVDYAVAAQAHRSNLHRVCPCLFDKRRGHNNSAGGRRRRTELSKDSDTKTQLARVCCWRAI